MLVLHLGNLWTFSNKSFTRVGLIHFYLKTCSLFAWWDLYFIAPWASGPYHCPPHRCRAPRGEGRPSRSDGRAGLRSEHSARQTISTLTLWHCDTVTVLQCDTVTLWLCDTETVTHCDCDTVTLWQCDTVTMWHSCPASCLILLVGA